MFILRSLPVLLVLTSIAGADDKDSITFKYKPVKKGDTRTMTRTLTMSLEMKVSVAGNVVQEPKQDRSEEESRKDTVLEVADGVPTKIKTRYIKFAEITDGKTKTSPVKGKTYIVEKGEDGLKITDESGETPSPAEIKQVSDDFKNLGTLDKMSKFLDGKTVKIGEAIDLPKDIAQSILGTKKDDPIQVKKFRLKLTKINPDMGLFKITVEFEGAPTPGTSMSMTLKGKIGVTPGCWPLDAKMKGTVEIEGSPGPPEQKIELTGSGPVTITASNSYK